MYKKKFSQIRKFLGKTQKQMGKLLSVSTKAVQSFEQGWRHIPSYIERQMLMLLSLKKPIDRNFKPCWEIIDCPGEWRGNCIVWDLKARHFCWFLNGTFCQGRSPKNWAEKIGLCRECEVFISILPEIK